MISTSPETAIKNIFERAATSLSNTREQLDKTRRVLKKAILQLSTSNDSDDNQINTILNEIRKSADNNINLNDLDSQLDKLLALMNHSDAHKNRTFYSALKSGLNEINCSETCASIINSFSEKKLSDDEISLEILKLIDATTQNRK